MALDKGYQILFLDQRGTGLSSTVTAQTLEREGGPMEQANYLRLFRADSIVEDCEAIRKNITADYPEEKKKWSIIGQSFGGFCSMTYLFSHPEALQEAYICAGLAPLVDQPDPVYRKHYLKLAERNHSYYSKYTEDIQRVKNIVHYLQTEKVKLPSGGTLSIARLRQLGINLGFHGSIDVVHETILRLASDLDYFGYFTRPTLTQFEELQPFDVLPLYALVHEAIYLQGNNASEWSADRMMKEHPAFMNLSTSNDEPILFTGEMVRSKTNPIPTHHQVRQIDIYPSMFADYIELQPLAPVADILSTMSSWSTFYNTAAKLADNKVPVYASIYVDDMYVAYDLALETAKSIGNCKYFVTNTMYHDAIGTSGKSEELFRKLWELRDDVMD
ncbi:MAG: hypothetical protein Q9220_000523 [cf. Caloplaca sp. 1 TL-2023]